MQDFVFKNFIMPLYFNNYKKSCKLKFYEELRKRDDLSLSALKEIQLANLQDLVSYCYLNIPYYKKLFENNDIHPIDIKSLKDYEKIPKLTKSDIRENLHSLVNPKLKDCQTRTDYTSGSTGEPLKLIRTHTDHDFGCALKLRSNAWCGWKYWHKSLWLITDLRHTTQLNNLKGQIGLAVNRRLMFNTKNITQQQMFEWVEQIEKFKPEFVYGYSSLLGEFSEFILENDIDLQGFKGVISTAEPLKKRKAISNAFNTNVFDQYGASEIPCVAHECKKGSMHMNIDEILVEFEKISDDLDEQRMIVTPLYLRSMPLLRYEINDTAAPVRETCSCGLNYPLMSLKIGRMNDNFISKEGKIASSASISWYLTKETAGLKQYQVVQEDYQDFSIKLICDEHYRPENEQNIRKILQRELKSEINAGFDYPDRIEPGKNGKIRPMISKVAGKLPAGKIGPESETVER